MIVPPVKITFDGRGPVITTMDNYPDFVDFETSRWGSFDSSPTAPIVYPAGAEFEEENNLSIHLWLGRANVDMENHVDWKVPVPFNGTASLQVSTNLTDWIPVTTVTNLTGSVSWYHWHNQTAKFFRVVPQC